MYPLGHEVKAPVHPRRVEHIEQHRVIGIGGDRYFDDASGVGIEPWNCQMMGEFVPTRGRQQTQNDFDGENREDRRPHCPTNPVCLSRNRKEMK